MADPFLTLAGPAPARAEADRWRQVALLSVAAAVGGDDRARVELAAALVALDCPAQAEALLAGARDDDPWARWWGVLAAGQRGDLERLDAALHDARAAVSPTSPDGRDVARRLADLAAELGELGGAEAEGARFALLGHRPRPVRRVLAAGRSSAAFLLDPSWERLRLVRLAPTDGPSAGNAAHLSLDALIEAVRRGESGPGRTVPDDVPRTLEPSPMLEALREEPGRRDERLLRLAAEVREERERLADERIGLEQERAALSSERARLRRARGPARPAPARTVPVALPTTPSEAAEVLGVERGAAQGEVERSWREMIARCHPDRVEGLHPAIRQRAADLTLAINAARDLLTTNGAKPRARRRGSG
jgi:DnaJ-domain-containing protein 1